MLTNNFSEIIHAAVQRLNVDKRGLSSDDMRNISLMLWGYLRLIKSGFTTKEDSSESSDEYYSALKGILDDVTKAQTNAIKKVKQGLMVDFNSDIDVLDNKLKAIIELIDIDCIKDVKGSVSDIQQLIKELREILNKELHNPYIGFESVLKSYFKTSTALKDVLHSLSKNHPHKQLSLCQEFMSKVTTSHLKKLTYWLDIEQTNQQCISYVISGEFIDLLTFN